MKYMWLLGILAIVACSAEGTATGVAGTGGSTSYAGTGGQDGDATDGGYQTPGYRQGDYAGNNSGGAGFGTGGSGTNPAAGQGGSWQAQLPDGSSRQAQEDDDGGLCGSVTVEADVEVIKQPGNLLIVFDRSGSMNDDWGGVPRYQAAGDAIIAAIEPMQELLTVGGIFFPSMPDVTTSLCNPLDPLHWIPGPDAHCLNLVGGSCEVNDITASDQINFGPAPDFIAKLPEQTLLTGAGMTPLEGGVNMADAALASTTFEGAVAVVILTDGEPNCGTIPENVNATVARWLSNGIKTYVVGLPGSDGASDLLTQLAVTGGTDRFIEPDDPAALQAEIATIVTDTVKTGLKSCEINLQQEEDADVEKLHLVVSIMGEEHEVPKQLSNGGWSVNADGTVATLEGSLCHDAKNGRFESVRFDFGCVELPVLLE